jgi:hypothetical protein
LFVESSPQQLMDTGVAVTNTSAFAIAVDLELLALDGSSTGRRATLTVPGNGHISAFLAQISGLASAAPFRGILRVSSPSPSIAALGFRGRYNERGDFLISTMFPVQESSAVQPAPLLFPHIADGAGYTTQFVVFDRAPAQ